MSDLWLERTLLVGPFLALVTSEKELLSLIDGIPGATPPDHWCGRESWQACTHTWSLGPDLMCIVAINLESTEFMTPTAVAALLVHEATHVLQATKQKIGGDIGNEAEAYAMQNICLELFNAYAKRMSKNAE
jgi:hypothetical protein